eukprot:Hpha_TRINITY_DN17963_c0_g1::TRINITY_DN17963_c0_g1_i1::g.33714::m.33714
MAVVTQGGAPEERLAANAAVTGSLCVLALWDEEGEAGEEGGEKVVEEEKERVPTPDPAVVAYDAVVGALDRYREEGTFDLQWVDICDQVSLHALRDGIVSRTHPLRRVIVGSCMLGDMGAYTLVKALRDAELPVEDIDLYFNQITDKGLHKVLDVIRDWAAPRDARSGVVLLPLERLNFGWNDIGDEGCRDMSELLRESRRPLSQLRLRCIGFAFCLITTAAAEDLAEEMKRNEYLSEVRLEGNEGVAVGVMDTVEALTAARTLGQAAERHHMGFFGRKVTTALRGISVFTDREATNGSDND